MSDPTPKRMKFSTFHLYHQFEGWSVKEIYDYHTRIVTLAEELGFDGIWVGEHHFRDYGTVPSIPTMLAFLAARTEKIRLGSGIAVLPLHNPIHLAEQMAQLDVLSNGRLDFGVGRGYQSIEFDGFQAKLSEARERFLEALDVIVGLWTTEQFHHTGTYYQTGRVDLVPTPLQKPHPPIYVGAVSPETVELIAKRGLPILADPAAPFGKITKAAQTWFDTASASGHVVDEADLVVSRSVHVAPTLEQAREDQARFEAMFDRKRIFNADSAPVDSSTGQVAKGFEYWEGRYLKGGEISNEFRWDQLEVIGDPERVIGQVKSLQDAGFSNLMCDFGSTRPIPFEEIERVLRLFAAEVMPAFRDA